MIVGTINSPLTDKQLFKFTSNSVNDAGWLMAVCCIWQRILNWYLFKMASASKIADSNGIIRYLLFARIQRTGRKVEARGFSRDRRSSVEWISVIKRCIRGCTFRATRSQRTVIKAVFKVRETCTMINVMYHMQWSGVNDQSNRKHHTKQTKR